jgi:hypothetical protein
MLRAALPQDTAPGIEKTPEFIAELGCASRKAWPAFAHSHVRRQLQTDLTRTINVLLNHEASIATATQSASRSLRAARPSASDRARALNSRHCVVHSPVGGRQRGVELTAGARHARFGPRAPPSVGAHAVARHLWQRKIHLCNAAFGQLDEEEAAQLKFTVDAATRPRHCTRE